MMILERSESMEGVSLEVGTNISIFLQNKRKKVVRVIDVHNKVTSTMVSGILRYLRGDFTKSGYNLRSYDPENAYGYLPKEIKFGNPGVHFSSDEWSVVPEEIYPVGFYNTGLQSPLTDAVLPTVKFETAKISDGGDRNSEILTLRTFIPQGQLLFKDSDRTPYPWVELVNGQYQTELTELGLISGTNALLARLVLSDTSSESSQYAPILITEDLSTIIEWRITVTSIGKDDVVNIISSSADINT